MRPYIKAQVTAKAERSLRSGHPWVFGEEVISISGKYQCGDIVDVCSQKGRYLGSGFINDNSKIRIRIISRNSNDKFDSNFWARRVRYAVDYRRTVMGDVDFQCCRLIFGEADGFPGLTVDRFGSVLVSQALSLGIDRIKTVIYNALLDYLRKTGEEIDVLYERSDSGLRTKEGLGPYKGFYSSENLLSTSDGITQITENGIRYNVDYINGQKTGFFLDQKYNRAAIWNIARGRRVLDCFTHTGAFALNAAAAGAESVCAVDVSSDALKTAAANAALNNLSDNISFVCEDVFKLFTDLSERGEKSYDFIILDPPAFTKSSSTLKNAERGYKEINLKAMKLLPRGGYLATCSCSHFMTNELFVKMLHSAAEDAAVSLRQVEVRQQAPDHPILWNVPETDYLKFYIFQIV